MSEVNTSGSSVDVGNIDMRFDLSGIAPADASYLGLLIDTDNDGVFNDETVITGATSLGSNVFEFASVSGITDGLRFTLAINPTPLPVELVEFNAQVQDDKVVNLTWQTLSEINNDYFSIERSTDGTNWEAFMKVEGAGNSIEPISYEATDNRPFSGLSYYRLKQVDFNEQFSYSNIRSVELHNLQSATVEVFPNPTKNKVTITANAAELEQFIIIDNTGKDVTNFVTVTERNEQNITLDLSRLTEGLYFIKTKTNVTKVYKQ